MNSSFVCKRCKKHFKVPQFYEERHELDSPPYERVEICPYCSSGDFFEFEGMIEKTAVAEQLLPVITMINKYINSIKNVHGNGFKNEELFGGVGSLAEFVSELFYYLPAEIDRKILTVDTKKECDNILMHIRGDF